MAISDLNEPYRTSASTPMSASRAGPSPGRSASRVRARAESRNLARTSGQSGGEQLSRSHHDLTSSDLAKGFQASSQDLLAEKHAREKAKAAALLLTPSGEDGAAPSPRWDRSCTFTGSLDELQHGELLADEYEHEPPPLAADEIPEGVRNLLR